MSALGANRVWPRTDRLWSARGGEDEIAPSVFNLLITGTVAYALLLYGWVGEVMVTVIQRAHLRLHVWELVVLFLSLATGAIVGHLIALGASPAKACVGLSVSAVCFGALSGPFFNHYRAGSITQVALATLTFTVFLGAAGIIYPKSLQSWRGPLCTAVVGLIFLQLGGSFMPALQGTPAHSIEEWIAIATFCAYVVYDFNRAQRIPRTTTNAVQVGAAVFLDIINIFVNLPEAMGSKKDEN